MKPTPMTPDYHPGDFYKLRRQMGNRDFFMCDARTRRKGSTKPVLASPYHIANAHDWQRFLRRAAPAVPWVPSQLPNAQIAAEGGDGNAKP